MSETTIIVPTWAVDFYYLCARNWQTAAVVLVTVILATAVTEYFKYHKKKTIEIISEKDKIRFNRYIAYILTASLTFFNVLGQFIGFATSNLSVLQQLPIIGKHVLTGLGVAYLLYNIRLQTWYKLLTAKLTKGNKQQALPAAAAPTDDVSFPTI